MGTLENDTTSSDFLAGVADERNRIGAAVRREYASARKRFEDENGRGSPNALALAAMHLAVSHAMERLSDKLGINLD